MPTLMEIRREVHDLGLKELKTADAVAEAFSNKDFLIFINSSCPNSTIARIALFEVIKRVKLPINAYTVFAGVDDDATIKARELLRVKASSPAIYIIKNGKIIFTLDRDALITLDRHIVVKKITDTIVHAYE